MRVTQSVFDRLIDLEPRELKETPKSKTSNLSELKAAVRRDLEWLLNARRYIDDADLAGLAESRTSIAAFGLLDITGMSVTNPAEQQRLIKGVESAIKLFEPRFIGLKVSVEPLSGVERKLKFRIEASLDVDPAPEPVAFDTVLDVGGGDFTISESR